MRQIVYDALVEPIGPPQRPTSPLNSDWSPYPVRRIAAASAALAATLAFGGHVLAPIPVKAVAQSGQFSNVITVRPALIYQSGVTPVQPVPVNATPGWEGVRLDYAFAKPFAASQQQFTGFLLGPPPTPQGSAGYQLNVAFAKPFAASQQHFQTFTRGSVPIVATPGWEGIRLDYAFAKRFPASLQQFQTFTRGSVPINATPGWEGTRLDAAFTKPLASAQQQFASVLLAPPVAPLLFVAAPLDLAFAKPVPASVQQYSSVLAPVTVATGVGQSGVFSNVLTRPAVIYQAGFTPVQPLATVTPSGFYSVSGELFAKPLSPSLQQFQTFTRGSVPIAATPGWESLRFDYRFTKPVNAALQPFDAAQSLALATAATGVGQSGQFGSVLSRPRIIYQAGVTPLRPLAAPPTPPLGWNASSPAVVSFAINIGDGGELAGFVDFQPQGWWPDYPVRFAKPVNAALQSYSLFVGLPSNNATGVGQSGSFSAVLIRPALIYQAGVTPVTVQASSTPQGFFGYQFDFAFAKRFPAACQQFEALKSPLTTTPVRGWFPDYPARFATPLSASIQQFQSFTRSAVPVNATPGWEGIRLDYAFAKPVAAAQQQFIGFLFPANPGNSKSHGWQNISPERFAKAFPVTLQQYEARGLPFIRFVPPPEPEPPPGGGHRKPPKKKSVQPIWDRPQQLAKAPATPAAKPAPAPTPKTAEPSKPPEFSKDEQSLLTRQILPAGPAIAPPAHATITLAEDNDTMTATAEWNDDELALALLLGDDLDNNE